MQAIGQQPLVSALLLILPLLTALAHKTDDLPPHLAKRSIPEGVLDGGSSSWQAPTSSDDVVTAKRFNEFVGKRAQVLLPAGLERLPDEILYKRYLTTTNVDGDSSVKATEKGGAQCAGKHSPTSQPLLHKRVLFDIFGKRVRLPYEFVGKRIFGQAWERVLGDTVEADAQLKDVLDILKERRRDVAENAVDHVVADKPKVSRRKRYAEWLGKRGGPIADQLLRDLVNKRISAMMRNRLQNSANPEFIGRREEDYVPSPADLQVKKRYTEFIGK